MERTADIAGDAYQGDTPQANENREQLAPHPHGEGDGLRPDYTVAPARDPDEYNWSMSATHVSVSNDDHGDQFNAMEWTDLSRPHAYGKCELHYRWEVYWHVYYTNMSMHLVEKRLKRYSKDQGWDWGGLLDEEGTPMQSRALKQGSVPGIGEINPGELNYKLDEWSGTGMFDNPGDKQSDTPFYGFSDYDEDSDMTSPRTCSECGQLMLDYDDWRKHVLREHVNTDRKPAREPQPVVDMDDVLPAGFNEAIMDKTVQRQSRLIHQLTHTATAQQPLIQGPMPFIYDIETDRIYVGHPGERHSDIQGRFTPGGIVEGLYDPKGSVQIRTDTDMPYTVRHMAELWYAMHPELQIKSIFLMQGEKRYKLASSQIGHKVRNLAFTDPAARAAYEVLSPLGNVYAVGGAVRDVVRDKTPKDIDLMVQGVDGEDVQAALESLPGRVDYTGKQFGVFRYRDPQGNEVEVALPRTERSTGAGHRDFEVVTSPYISVGEDLGRRDFTGNAMAVNLATGDLVDPHHGSEDLKSGVLRTVSDKSFLEDPLRILRAFGSVSRHGLDPDPSTYHDLAAHGHLLGELPRERLHSELDKLMGGDDPAKAIDLMETTNVLQYVLPDVAATTGFDQKSKYHQLLLGDHIKSVLRLTAQQTDDVDVRWAALLHDIGKPGSQWFDEEGLGHYYKNDKGEGEDHESLGADMTEKLLTELRFPTDRIARIKHLVQHHMFPPFGAPNGARKFINRVGDEHADDLLKLRWADSGGKDVGNPTDGSVVQMGQLVNQVRNAREPTNKKMLAINGDDLIQNGFAPGPQMGQILEFLMQQVIENPELNTPEQLLALAHQFGEVAQTPPVAGNHNSANLRRSNVMYHVTSPERRESIRTLGLIPGHESGDEKSSYGTGFSLVGPAVFLSTTLEDANGIKQVWRRDADVWEVDTSGLHLDVDPSNPDHGYYTTDSIPPERLHPLGRDQRRSNILDPIKDTLDPDVFNSAESYGPNVKPKIVEWVKKKVYTTMTKAGWPDPSKYLTLDLTGSLTTYQWSESSDFDISLWIDVERFPEWVRADLIAMMIENCDGVIVPGTTHPMQCFVVDSMKFKPDQLYKPGLRSAYKLDDGDWYVLPEKARSIDVSKQWPEHIRYARMCVDKMKMMLRYDKYAVKVYWNFLHRQRFLAMRAGKGDYDINNIVYKMLSNEGLFPYIMEATGEYIA